VLGGLGVGPGTRILDAGCATGRYALALEAHGYRATGVDRSPDLLAIARRHGARVVVGDLVALPMRRVYGAVLCRGVLNDVLEDDERRDPAAEDRRSRPPADGRDRAGTADVPQPDAPGSSVPADAHRRAAHARERV